MFQKLDFLRLNTRTIGFTTFHLSWSKIDRWKQLTCTPSPSSAEHSAKASALILPAVALVSSLVTVAASSPSSSRRASRVAGSERRSVLFATLHRGIFYSFISRMRSMFSYQYDWDPSAKVSDL